MVVLFILAYQFAYAYVAYVFLFSCSQSFPGGRSDVIELPKGEGRMMHRQLARLDPNHKIRGKQNMF